MTDLIRMSYEFQLPLYFGTEDASSGLGWWVKDQEGSVIIENSTRVRCEAICEAVNSHDTQLADMDRALERLKLSAKLWERWLSGELQKKGIVADPNWELDYQTYTELREKYPKEEKDANKV